MEYKSYKTRICNDWITFKTCKNKDKCNFAHGIDDPNIPEYAKCRYLSECYNEKCKRIHPNDWDPNRNKPICIYFKNGNCVNGDNCKYSHIEKIDNKYDTIKNDIIKDLNKDNITDVKISENSISFSISVEDL